MRKEIIKIQSPLVNITQQDAISRPNTMLKMQEDILVRCIKYYKNPLAKCEVLKYSSYMPQ